MINPVVPNSPQQINPAVVADTYPGQRMERNPEFPRQVVDQKQDIPSAREEIPREEVEKATEKLNRLMGIIDKRLQFKIHDKTNQLMVKVIDVETGDVINELPPKKLLDTIAAIRELAGMFFDKRV